MPRGSAIHQGDASAGLGESQHNRVEAEVTHSLQGVDIAERKLPSSRVTSPDPWWFAESTATTMPWATQPWVWSPPPLEPRGVRQEACFVMGGIPSTVPFRNARRRGRWRPLVADEVKACMSIPFLLITYDRAVAVASGRRSRGRPPATTAFTIRITNKARVRGELEDAFRRLRSVVQVVVCSRARRTPGP